METVKNGFNKVSPLRVGSLLTDAGDAAGHVIPEVLVQKVVNRMFGKQPVGWVESGLTHLFSIPFIGGLGAPIAPAKHPGLDGDYSTQFQAGFAGVPAVLIGQYLVELLSGRPLFHWDFGVRDTIIAAVSKTITRPVLSTLGKLSPDFYTNNYNRLQARFDMQAQSSNLRMKEKRIR